MLHRDIASAVERARQAVEASDTSAALTNLLIAVEGLAEKSKEASDFANGIGRGSKPESMGEAIRSIVAKHSKG